MVGITAYLQYFEKKIFLCFSKLIPWITPVVMSAKKSFDTFFIWIQKKNEFQGDMLD